MSAPDVALISPFPTLGERHGGWTGVASYSANLAAALDDAGARVTVLASREDGLPDTSSFSASLRPSPRSRRTRSTAATTSSSSATVVLIGQA